MLKRLDLPACPVETALTLMGDRWKVLIVRDLLTGTKRFGELKKALVGISQTTLAHNGGERACPPPDIRGGASEGGVHADGIGAELEADP